jgi:hypothetical protein
MCTVHSTSLTALLSPVSLPDKRKKKISFHYNLLFSFRKDSLWDIAIKINNGQQDTKPSTGSQPKEKTILILGSKGVVSIVIMINWFPPLFID